MPIDPRSILQLDPRMLQQIGNPTGGKLTQLGGMYNQGQQDIQKMRMLQQEQQESSQEFQMKRDDTNSKLLLAFTDSLKKDANLNETSTPEDLKKAQVKLMRELPQQHQQMLGTILKKPISEYGEIDKINELSGNMQRRLHPELYKAKDVESIFSKADISKFTPESIAKAEESGNRSDLRLRPDKKGSSPVGTSEFERVLNASLKAGKITAERYDALMLQRTEGLAGEMTVKDTTKLNSKERKERIEDSDALRDEYGEGSKHFSDINENIDAAMAALDSGDTTVADQLLNKILTQTGDTDIRAVQMYNIMDSSSGDIWDRFTGDVGKYLGGSRTEFQKQQIRTTLEAFRDQYSKPRSDNVKNRYRFLAKEKGLDPFVVVPAKNPLEIKTSPFTSHMTPREKLQLIRRQFPTWRPQ